MSTAAVPFGWAADSTDLLSLVESLRSGLEPVHRSLAIGHIALHAADVIDEADMTGAPRRQAVIFDALERQARTEGEIASGETGGHPLPVTIMFDTDPEDSTLYFWGEIHFEAYARRIDNMGVGSWYPYWPEVSGRSGRPYGVTEAQWQTRAETWSRVLRGIPAGDTARRMSITIGEPSGLELLTEARAVHEAIPSLDERVVRWMGKDPARPVPPDAAAYYTLVEDRAREVREHLTPIRYEDIAGASS